ETKGTIGCAVRLTRTGTRRTGISGTEARSLRHFPGNSRVFQHCSGTPSDVPLRILRPDVACYSDAMPRDYIPILIFLVVAILFPVVKILAAKLIRPSAPFLTKLEAYECGIKAASDSRGRYTVRFYIIAILFVIFDVETIFLFPWAVRYRALSWFGVW